MFGVWLPSAGGAGPPLPDDGQLGEGDRGQPEAAGGAGPLLPDDGQLGEGDRGQLEVVGQGDDLHASGTLGRVVLQALGHFFLLCGR